MNLHNFEGKSEFLNEILKANLSLRIILENSQRLAIHVNIEKCKLI